MDKLHVAREQLSTALELFFANEKPVSVHTLAGAAREILERACRLAGKRSFIDDICDDLPDMTREKLYRIINEYRNAFKHYKPEDQERDEEILKNFTDEKNDHMLFLAVWDYMQFAGRLTVAIQVFQAWYYSMYPDRLAEDVDVDHFTSALPKDLSARSRGEQKALARATVAWALRQPEILRDPKTELTLGNMLSGPQSVPGVQT
jgi:hypothetical protein